MADIGTLLSKFDEIHALGTHMYLSLFQRKVYLLTLCIPEGYVTTYGAIASLLKTGPRNVGSALRKNPFTGYVDNTEHSSLCGEDIPKVPCHRVVSSSGIGGFFGSTSGDLINRKIQLLSSEGVVILKGKVNKSQILSTDQLLEELIKNT